MLIDKPRGDWTKPFLQSPDLRCLDGRSDRKQTWTIQSKPEATATSKQLPGRCWRTARSPRRVLNKPRDAAQHRDDQQTGAECEERIGIVRPRCQEQKRPDGSHNDVCQVR